MVERRVEPVLRRALDTFRIVVLQGPRQSGKTTLARQITNGGTFLSLDDPAVLSLAVDDPIGFIADRRRPVVIDEIQRGGDDLVRAIKLVVDADPAPGSFLLTGSADFLTVPVLSESLAGRAVFFNLAPFSAVELHAEADGLLARLCANAGANASAAATMSDLLEAPPSALTRTDYAERICRGGYPEVLGLSDADRIRWFESYVLTSVTRDIVEVTGARRSTELPRLLRAVAARTAGELVLADLHRDLGFGRVETTADYLSHLEMTHLVARLGGWASSTATQAKRRPKVLVTDSGLAAATLGVNAQRLGDASEASRGPLHETYAVNELRRQAMALNEPLRFSHFRDARGREIDLLIERPDGRLIAVEVKAGATVRPIDAKWLAWLADLVGNRFEVGVVLFTGQRPLRIADRIVALPMSYLWEI
ncbi:ATP-binding protein [Candidatus Poriferisodalis sp.]|uniref:ATP-binding protein n=1 Tax=Candidatus Poriferisodalis sp. TaxID=3101277 RepID=UPI003D0E7749